MEYVDGDDLSTYAEQGLTLVQFISLATQIADALGAAHRAGVVHRDLKPSNILVTDDGRIKLCDFGVARMATGENDRLTQTGQIMATPGYMSPEQSTGEPVDMRSDIYSLGVILWELAVGARPFEGRSFGEWVLLHATREPLPPSRAERTQLRGDIPEALDAAILRCLAKRPEDRFAGAGELRDALAAIVCATAPAAQPAAPRRRWPFVVAGAAAIAAIAGLSALLHGSRPAPVRAAAAPFVSPPAAIEFEPTEVASTPASFKPVIVQQTRPKKKQPRVVPKPREDDEQLSASALKDPFGGAP